MEKPKFENLIFRLKNETAFWKNWRELAAELKAGPRYNELAIKRFLIVAEGAGLLENDLSFVCLENGKPAAAAFLPIEKMADGYLIGFSGGYTLAPLCQNRAVAKAIFVRLEKLALTNGVSKIMFQIDPLQSLNSFNYLEKYGYLDTSILTYLVDLKIGSDLLKLCRKGHACDIKKLSADKRFKTEIYDSANDSYEEHEIYRQLHEKCSGRQTRSKESFDNQFEGLKRGEAILVALKYEGRPAAYAYFEIANGRAVYASGADEPALAKFPLYHSVIFSAMNDLRRRGVTVIELSQPASPSAQFDYYPDTKQINIAVFKRGFPGRLSNFFRGVKYFSKSVFRADLEEFGKNYEKYISYE